jgi:hypothetical protein
MRKKLIPKSQKALNILNNFYANIYKIKEKRNLLLKKIKNI